MKQKITIHYSHIDLSRKIKLLNVYQIDNRLVAISQLLTTGIEGNSLLKSEDSITVNTTSARELPVTHYVINDTGKTIFSDSQYKITASFTKIKEINNCSPLPIAAELSSNPYKWWKKIDELEELTAGSNTPSHPI